MNSKKTRRTVWGMGVGTILLTGSIQTAAQSVDSPNVLVEKVATGLQLPTVMAFLGPQDFLIAEKNSGRVKRVTGGAVTGVVLDLPVNARDTRGLLGMTLHPDFAGNGFVYLFYSRAEVDGGEWLENRVSRFVWDGAVLQPDSETLIVAFPADAGQSNGPGCEGGKILFGPDHKLYGTTGDLGRGGFENARFEQNTSDEAVANVGGIFRLNDDGTIPTDNPFVNHASESIRRLYSFGVRNSYGMAFADNGELWMTENGPEVYDEINHVTRGWNSGWLKIMGPDARDATYERNQHTAYDESDLLALPGSHYQDPQFSFLQPLGITAIAFLNSDRYPAALRGRAVIGDTNFGQLYLFELNAARDGLLLPEGLADRVADDVAERNLVRWGEGWGVTSDLQIGPDGLLYQVSLTHGAVLRLRPLPPLSGRSATSAGR